MTPFDQWLSDLAVIGAMFVLVVIVLVAFAGILAIAGRLIRRALGPTGSRTVATSYVDTVCPRCRSEKTIERPADLPASVYLVSLVCSDCDDGGQHQAVWHCGVEPGPIKIEGHRGDVVFSDELPDRNSRTEFSDRRKAPELPAR